MSKTRIPDSMRKETEAHFHRRCAYCQSPQDLMNVTFEVDHIIPEKAGGKTVRDNLAFACPLCNGFKGAQTRGRDPITGHYVELFHPRRQKWSRHFCWSEGNQCLAGRTQSGRATIEALHLNNLNLMRLRTIWLAIGCYPPDWITPLIIKILCSTDKES